jgi:hypothetical protein
MQPFDLEIGAVDYAVFPEGNEVYVIYKNGKEYMSIQKDSENQWLKLDDETALPLFEPNEEVNAIGRAIEAYVPEEDDDAVLPDEDEELPED